MSAIDDAIEAALRRQREDGAGASARRAVVVDDEPKKAVSQAADEKVAVDPWSPEAILRAANEDDDLYDPYSDYMDALARSSYEEPEEDPWR